MEKIKFSVVIPTRERCNTLEAAIRTCVTQNYDNFDIVISDNFSQDDTKEVVDSFRDNRIVYLNTGKRVSMSENYEFALAQIAGDFVIMLGDDDGLLPGALKELNELIGDFKCEAISWKRADYFWPDCQVNRARNMLVVPLYSKIYKRNAKEFLKDVLSCKQHYSELPSVYHGVVSSRIIKYIKQLSGGQLIHSMIPDIYTSVVFAAAIDTYCYSTKPYSISGVSQHSIGTSYFSSSNKHSDKTAERQYLSEPNIPCHNNIILAPSMHIIIAESFMQARDHFLPASQYHIDLKEIIRQAIKEVMHSPQEQYDQVANAINYIGKKYSLIEYVDRILKHTNHVHHESLIIYIPGYHVIRRHFALDCSKYGVRDVYQASLLCKLILERKTIGLNLSLPAIAETTLHIGKKFFNKCYYRISR
jgi:glycosyltransferase involved in cell wall biosynthesis